MLPLGMTSVCNKCARHTDNYTIHNNNKYISRALNPSVSNLPEAQSAVHIQLKLSKLHIQLKPSKQRNQRCQENKKQKKAGDRWVNGHGPNIK